MSTPTPGPWAFTKSIDSDGDVCFDISQETGADYTSHLSDVAYCRLFKTYVSEHAKIQEANAQLIAAAPELLEALRDMLAGWKYIRESHGDLYGVGWDRAQDKAVEAIAKATGAAA